MGQSDDSQIVTQLEFKLSSSYFADTDGSYVFVRQNMSFHPRF